MCSALMRMSLGVAMATSVMAFGFPRVVVAQERTERINLTAARPLLATKTLWIGLSPPMSATNWSSCCFMLDTRLGTPKRRGLLFWVLKSSPNDTLRAWPTGGLSLEADDIPFPPDDVCCDKPPLPASRVKGAAAVAAAAAARAAPAMSTASPLPPPSPGWLHAGACAGAAAAKMHLQPAPASPPRLWAAAAPRRRRLLATWRTRVRPGPAHWLRRLSASCSRRRRHRCQYCLRRTCRR
mmetsp:Transcript_42702/g.128167  ORF Transcript_42702/g.128167 Transcript_42702/m.128167 type:complete len:239 (+) Transcript_42702:4477-5193(+)